MQAHNPTTLQRLEHPSNADLGGVLLTTPSGLQIAAYWRSGRAIVDTLATAKQCAADLLQHLIEKHEGRGADDINWVSVTAAIQRHVQDWNGLRGAGSGGEPALH